MNDLHYPIKLDDDYTCQGVDARGVVVAFSDLLRAGDKVGPSHPDDVDFEDEAMYLSGVVVRRDDGMWIEALSAGSDGEDRPDE